MNDTHYAIVISGEPEHHRAQAAGGQVLRGPLRGDTGLHRRLFRQPEQLDGGDALGEQVPQGPRDLRHLHVRRGGGKLSIYIKDV